MALWVKNPTSVAWVTEKARVQSPARHSVEGSSTDCCSCSVGYVTAVTQIQSLAWEFPHAVGVAIKKGAEEFPSWLSC